MYCSCWFYFNWIQLLKQYEFRISAKHQSIHFSSVAFLSSYIFSIFFSYVYVSATKRHPYFRKISNKNGCNPDENYQLLGVFRTSSIEHLRTKWPILRDYFYVMVSLIRHINFNNKIFLSAFKLTNSFYFSFLNTIIIANLLIILLPNFFFSLQCVTKWSDLTNFWMINSGSSSGPWSSSMRCMSLSAHARIRIRWLLCDQYQQPS